MKSDFRNYPVKDINFLFIGIFKKIIKGEVPIKIWNILHYSLHYKNTRTAQDLTYTINCSLSVLKTFQ